MSGKTKPILTMSDVQALVDGLEAVQDLIPNDVAPDGMWAAWARVKAALREGDPVGATAKEKVDDALGALEELRDARRAQLDEDRELVERLEAAHLDDEWQDSFCESLREWVDAGRTLTGPQREKAERIVAGCDGPEWRQG